MTVHVGDVEISEVTEGSNNVIQVGGTFAAPKRYVASGFRNTYKSGSGTYDFTTQVEYNDEDQWTNTNRYTFPKDGVYKITFNSTLYTGVNDYCQFRYNGGTFSQNMYGSAWYGYDQIVDQYFLFEASEGDYFYVYTRTMYHAGGTEFNDLTIIQVA